LKRTEFEHAIRAAGSILGTSQLMVIGSQALHASVADDLPDVAQRSVEVDIVAFDDVDEQKADLIDGSIGEASMFHATFGYFAQGVSESTAVLPDGWQQRLVRFETPETSGVTAWCLEVHDLWISKAVANRDKDREFCRELVNKGLVDRDVLRARLDATQKLAAEQQALIRQEIEGW
jgi:hypothetical protein